MKILKTAGWSIIILVLTIITIQGALADTTTGLISHWSLTTDFTDEEQSNDFTASGTTISNSWARFDNTDDFMTTGNGASNFTLSNNWTICYYLNTTSADRDGLFTHNNNGVASQGWISELRNGVDAGKIRYQIQTGNGSQVLLSDHTYNGGSQTYHCLVVDDSNIYWYKDGSNVQNQTMNGTMSNPTYALGFGGLRDTNTTYIVGDYDYNGTIKEVSYYNRALTSSDISELYSNNGNPAAGSPPTTFLDITVTNINTFNATINGTLWTTTNGTINTNYNQSEPFITNITIQAENYFDDVYTNYNTSADISTTLARYPIITSYNEWNNTQILIFNVTINSTTYNTTNGNISVPYNQSMNVYTQAVNYYSQNETIALTADGLFNTTKLYQSIITIISKEINTLLNITSFSIWTENGERTTTNGTITLRPNLATYTWNWTTPNTWFNVTNLAFTVDDTTENFTISNLYAHNLSFIDSLSLQTITPNCTQDGYEYSSYDYNTHNTSTNLTCTLTGYQDKNFSLGTPPEQIQLNMTPALLNLIFTESTEGYVETSSCSALPNSCDYFNSTTTYIEQANISTGYVTVKFNPDGSGNWQQIFKYYNDHDTHVKTYILVETPDLVKSIKIASDGNPLENARVCAQALGTNPETNATEWLTTYCEYTNQDGEANLLVNDQNTYQICAQADNYIANCEIFYITPAETTVSKIDLAPEEAEGGSNYIWSSCAPTLGNETSCTLTVTTGEIYNSICVDYATNTSKGTTCTSTTTSKTYNYNVDWTNTNWELNISLDGTLTKTFTHQLINESAIIDVDINWDLPDQNGQTMIDKLKSDPTYLIVFYILMTIIGVIMGWMAEKYFNGYGIYGTALWFGIIGAAGFYLFFVPAAIIVLRAIIQSVIPLVK